MPHTDVHNPTPLPRIVGAVPGDHSIHVTARFSKSDPRALAALQLQSRSFDEAIAAAAGGLDSTSNAFADVESKNRSSQ
jgi:hypothetical protein